MKKSLVLLPLLGGFLLAGCTITIGNKTFKFFEKEQKQEQNQQQGGGGRQQAGPKELEADITINKDAIVDYLNLDKTYPDSDFDFSLGGVNFHATSGVGNKTSNDGGGNYYFEQNALQFRKQGHENGEAGVISVTEAVSASKITIHWFATYASEETKYQPVVLTGDKADAITTNVAANEGSPVQGVKANAKEGERDAYNYTTTYNISGKNFFAVSAPNGAMYVKDIIIHK